MAILSNAVATFYIHVMCMRDELALVYIPSSSNRIHELCDPIQLSHSLCVSSAILMYKCSYKIICASEMTRSIYII